MSSTMKQQITERVVPSYCTAYKILNEHIVQKLLQMDVNSNEETVKILANSMVCAAKNVQQELQIASKSIEQICNAADLQISQLIISVGQQEANVHQSQAAVNQANVNLQQVQQQVSLAETAVHDAHRSVSAADQEVHDAHRAVDRARRCGRRRKRFLGVVKKVWRNVIIKPVCSVVNSGGIDRAKDRRRMAEESLHNTRHRLQMHQQDLGRKQTEYSAAQTRLHTANIQLQTTTSTLEQQRSQRLVLINLLKQFKDIEIHLSNVLSTSNVLVDELVNLIDFETVISPLQNIYNFMLENQLMIPFGFEISAETTAKIKVNLDQLSKSLPNMPLYTASETNGSNIPDNKCNFADIKQQCSARSIVRRSVITSSTISIEKLNPVYRYFTSGVYFYTINPDEIGTITLGSIGKYEYKFEGIGFHLFTTQLSGTVPLYRYGVTAYKHFYTTNREEIGTNVAGASSKGMTCEGIMGYAYSTQQIGTCPLYRYVHTSSSQHFYTIHTCEIGTITMGTIGRYSYKFEGIQAYVPTSFPCPQDLNKC